MEELPIEEAKSALAETVREWKQKYGRNYWKALLLEACGNNEEVWQWLMTKEDLRR